MRRNLKVPSSTWRLIIGISTSLVALAILDGRWLDWADNFAEQIYDLVQRASSSTLCLVYSKYFLLLPFIVFVIYLLMGDEGRKKLRHWFSEKLRRSVEWTVIMGVLVALGIYLATVVHRCTGLMYISADWPSNRTGTTHAINIITFVGAVLAVIGFWYTYQQLKHAYDRILSYSDFYDMLDEFFDEIDEGKANNFFFYGSTILPGNISMGESELVENRLKRLKARLKEIWSREGKYKFIEDASIIIPAEEKYDEGYGFFYSRRLSTYDDARYQDPGEWKRLVDRKKNDAVQFQRELASIPVKPRSEKLSPQDDRYGEPAAMPIKPRREKLSPIDDRYKDISTAYFFSNGRQIIYARPLHYVSAAVAGDERDRSLTPHLVGFRSRDGITVSAFREHFDELRGKAELQRVRAMYDRHPRNAPNLTNELRKYKETFQNKNKRLMSTAELRRYDYENHQDHFFRHSKGHIENFARKLKPGDRLLEIGLGFGATARYLSKYCKSVTAIELQSDRCRFAVYMNRELKIRRVHVLEGDACLVLPALQPESFDSAIALLSILHLAEKSEFLKTLGRRIKPGGKVYIEDYMRNTWEGLNEEAVVGRLRDIIACPGLLTFNEYKKKLEQGGLTIIHPNNGTENDPQPDVTLAWHKAAKRRYEKTEQDRKKAGTHDRDFDKEQAFNEGVVRLFDDKIIAGVRIFAEKPLRKARAPYRNATGKN